MRRRTPRRGVVLLEAIVALTILTIAALASVAMVRQAVDSVRRAREAERDIRKASTFMEAIALWPRADLDRHLGNRAEGPWRLQIDRPVPTLYLVALTDSSSRRELVRTALFRPEPPGAP
ncbi:MAG TPA: type II secretion system protein [Gemmatimonadaceae bacterium]|jgi:type II secretory pathway pseudopilin PulG|nr:type II secretion system protein [Gemmatimonadaceae bacterium]